MSIPGPPLRKETDYVRYLLAQEEAVGGAGMHIIGSLIAVGLPLGGLAPEPVTRPARFSYFGGVRRQAGLSGSTVVRLQHNGQPVAGSELSWSSSDPDDTYRDATIDLVVDKGDVLSLELLGAEPNAAYLLTRAI